MLQLIKRDVSSQHVQDDYTNNQLSNLPVFYMCIILSCVTVVYCKHLYVNLQRHRYASLLYCSIVYCPIYSVLLLLF